MIERNESAFTPKQGQYLAFIDTYTKVHGVPRAEADMARYFKVTGGSVHQMLRVPVSRLHFAPTPQGPLDQALGATPPDSGTQVTAV